MCAFLGEVHIQENESYMDNIFLLKYMVLLRDVTTEACFISDRVSTSTAKGKTNSK